MKVSPGLPPERQLHATPRVDHAATTYTAGHACPQRPARSRGAHPDQTEAQAEGPRAPGVASDPADHSRDQRPARRGAPGPSQALTGLCSTLSPGTGGSPGHRCGAGCRRHDVGVAEPNQLAMDPRKPNRELSGFGWSKFRGAGHCARREDGTRIEEMCRRAEISVRTYYRWRRRDHGLTPTEMKRLKQLEEVNQRLKRLMANLSPDQVWLRRNASSGRILCSKRGNSCLRSPLN